MAHSSTSPILCLGITPCLQRTLRFRRLCTGEVNRATQIIETASGKATNVARVIRALGGTSQLLSPLGGDTGRKFEALLKSDGILLTPILSHNTTRICQTLLDDVTGNATELVEEASPVDPEETLILHQQLNIGLAQTHWLVISGSPPPGNAPTLYRDVMQQAQRFEVRVLLDTQKQPLLEALPASPWLVKLNQQELAVTLGRDIRTPNEMKDAALVLVERGARHVVVTQGSHTVWWVSRKRIQQFSPPKIEVVNPIGSGDAMLAGIAVGVARGDSLEASIRLGIAAGAANARTLTSGVVQYDSVLELLSDTVRK